ncbi:MAG: protein-glutamate O-methyltransferase [Alphaproteobacteria bacterium]|nr:protein-glutamate O-methyltransferase [Alphaproteobacteria bacterium]MBU0798576.1 protein-glutamate O-methyltransferase [Alphaproteobacteria bacterium]MBU0888131.1 protein-glutamate O-methyltransferase [Alphaproteobacteria bacterium]MBU1811576.1 protein-glutamate O-methyltransferase [Alphaproteobacteria bacterium]MBU2092062.1 protein-glutamate O-methyltransferase [Alphaproteobacteria bacterium]
MKPEDFTLLANLVRDQSGLVLTQEKIYLLESRLMPVARSFNLKTLEELVQIIRQRNDSQVVKAVVDAMTTNESLFFRDMKPFNQLKDLVLPRLMEKRQSTRRMRIWSAACSSGQEPYSIAMMLKEETRLSAGWKFDILATDLSLAMVERAKSGVYSQFEVQRGLPINYLVKYFKQDGDKWRIDSALRENIQFKTYNLLHDLSPLGQFDIVFCRNVLIYFDQPTKAKVLEAISKRMAPDGILYLGGAETVLGISDRFQPMPGERGLYTLTDLATGGTKSSPASPTASPAKPAPPPFPARTVGR